MGTENRSPCIHDPHGDRAVVSTFGFGDFAGGRVLLSDDLILLDAVAALVGRRIDEIRLEAERVAAERREQEMRRLATEA